MEKEGHGRGSIKSFRASGLIVACAMLFGITACTNPQTPAGYVGYVIRVPFYAGKMSFYGLQTGPTSTGLGWRLFATNVSVTPFTTTESFYGKDAVLSKDNLELQFAVNLIWHVDPARVKQFMERFTTLVPGDAVNEQDPNQVVEVAYANYLRQPLRTDARDEIQRLDALDVKDQITPIGQRVAQRLRTLTKNTPFVIQDVVVGTIQYPQTVSKSVSQMMAATQQLKRTEIEAQTRVAEAQGISKAMAIINQSLTPAYIQYEAIKAQERMVGAPNHTVIYIPVGNMGVPLVGTFDASGATLGKTGGVVAAPTAVR